jgi:hypothetical protein
MGGSGWKMGRGENGSRWMKNVKNKRKDNQTNAEKREFRQRD